MDNLISADVVLADGRLVTTDEDRHPDLFWAIRGGGGNFGVVTNFRLRLHPVDTVVAGPTVWPVDRTAELVRWYDDFMARADRDVYGFFMTMTVPPGPRFPEELHGEKVCGVLWCHLGSPEQVRADILEPVQEFGEPSFSHVEPMPYPALQSAFDGLYPPGLHWYWKGHSVSELRDEAAEIIQEYGERLPTGLCTMHLYPVDGAPNDIPPEATAYRQRNARWSQVFAGVARDAEDIEKIRAWSRGHWQALTPHVGETAYINFLMADDDAVVRATYGDNYDRLQRIKAEYDPTNLFRVNQNIPAGG